MLTTPHNFVIHFSPRSSLCLNYHSDSNYVPLKMVDGQKLLNYSHMQHAHIHTNANQNKKE